MTLWFGIMSLSCEIRVSNSSEEVRGLVRAGHAAIRVGDYEAARTTYERAVSLDPENMEAQDGLRDAERRIGARVREGTIDTIEYCYRHPETETGLHCVQCGRPICFRCSTPAAVGQLCPECRKGRRAPNYQGIARQPCKRRRDSLRRIGFRVIIYPICAVLLPVLRRSGNRRTCAASRGLGDAQQARTSYPDRCRRCAGAWRVGGHRVLRNPQSLIAA